jgi:hypothetical protein
MASVVCTTAFQLEQLTQIAAQNEGRYGVIVPTTVSNDPAFIRLFQSYALAELQGATDYFLYVDPYGKQPFVVGMLTTLATLADKMVADSFQFEYTVQSINTLSVLTSLEIQANAKALGGYILKEQNAREAQAAANFNALGGYILKEQTERIAADTANFNALGGYILKEQNAREAQAAANFNALGGYILKEQTDRITADAGVLNQAKADVNAVQSQLTALVGANVTQLQDSIKTVAEQAITEVKNAVSTAEQFATGLAGGAVTSAVAQAVAQLQPQINAIETETDSCLAPLCDTVTPNAKQLGNLGKLLSGFTDAALLGVLLAVLVEAVHNPGQLATDIENDLGSLVTGAASGLRSLIGV